MRFIMAFIWSFCLVTLLNYVVGSIANVPFDLTPGIIMSLFVAVLVIVLGEVLPNKEVADH
ncbi:MAG TPA: YjzD family protein [Sporosarcina sp.]|nr:YjzD family protein [Sporosarcina sp.]